MAEKIRITPKQLNPLKLALKNLSKFLNNASDDFAFEMGIIADTPKGVVIQLNADAIDGSEHELQIMNLSANFITYTALKNNKFTRLWEEVGLRGDYTALYPLYAAVIQELVNLGIAVDRIDWDVFGACNGALTKVSMKFNKKTGGHTIRLLTENPWGEGDF